MKINELAKRTGLGIKTIRFYEERGLITPDFEERNGKKWRDYSARDAERLFAVSVLRRAFFPVGEIKKMLDEPQTVAATLAAHRRSLDEMYESLTALRAALASENAAAANSAEALAAAIAAATAELPLPRADIEPRFRHIDALEETLSPPRPQRKLRSIYSKKCFVIMALVFIAALLITAAVTLIDSTEFAGAEYRFAGGGRGAGYARREFKGSDGSRMTVTVYKDKEQLNGEVERLGIPLREGERVSKLRTVDIAREGGGDTYIYAEIYNYEGSYFPMSVAYRSGELIEVSKAGRTSGMVAIFAGDEEKTFSRFLYNAERFMLPMTAVIVCAAAAFVIASFVSGLSVFFDTLERELKRQHRLMARRDK